MRTTNAAGQQGQAAWKLARGYEGITIMGISGKLLGGGIAVVAAGALAATALAGAGSALAAGKKTRPPAQR